MIMDTPSLLGRGINGTRGFFNTVDLRIFGVVLALATWMAVWLLVGSAFLPARYDLAAGDVAADLIHATRTLTFENRAETERRQQQASGQVTKVYVFDATVLPRVTRNANAYFDGVTRIVAEERALAQAASQPYDAARAARRIRELPGQPAVGEATAGVLSSLDDASMAQVRSSVIESVKRILEGNVTEATLVTDQDRLKSVIGTMALTAEEVAAAGDIASVLLEPNSLYSAEKTQQRGSGPRPMFSR